MSTNGIGRYFLRSRVPVMMGVPAYVIVTSSFPISGDGSEAAGAFVADLAEELSKQVPVRVVAPGAADAREHWVSGVEVFRYAAPHRPLSTLRPWHPVDAMQVLQVLRSGSRATERAVEAGPVSHILGLWALPCGEWARRSARRHGIAYSIWTLGSDIWSLGRIPVVRSRLRVILRDAEHCWSDGFKLAEDTREIAGREVGFLPSTRRIEHQRTEPLRMVPPYRLLFIGRWHLNKGVDLLLEALEFLSEDDWVRIERVSICGGGPLESVVQAGVTKLKAALRPVELHGYLDRHQAQRAMLEADLLLIPSRIESIPVVFSDGVKLGCRVVAMPVGDLPSIFSEHPVGVVANRVDACSFRDALRVALTNPLNCVDEIKAVAAKFSLGSVVESIISPERG